MHDHRMIGGTAFDLENLAHGGWIGGIRAEPIDGLGRKHHQIAGPQGLDGFFDFSLSRPNHIRMISRLRRQHGPLNDPERLFYAEILLRLGPLAH